MSIDESLAVLRLHHLNIGECTTFEAYKAVQLKYLEILIADYETKKKMHDYADHEVGHE